MFSPHIRLLLQAAGWPAKGFHPQPIIPSNANWWVATILFSCFTMIVILRVFDYRRLVQLLNGVLRQSSVSLLYREEYALTGRVSILLLLNYLLVVSLFCWQACKFFKVDIDGLIGFGTTAAAIAVAYFVKIITTRILGSVFEMREAAAEYSYNILLFNKTAGLLLFPIVLLLAYARQLPPDYLVYTGICILLITLAFRMLRLFLIGYSGSAVSFFYIILYLCTLEILPFIVLIKVFVGKYQSFHPY